MGVRLARVQKLRLQCTWVLWPYKLGPSGARLSIIPWCNTSYMNVSRRSYTQTLA
jgi:hypothetical protein